MSSPELTLERRALLDSLVQALGRRHEVLDAITGGTDRGDAAAAIQRLLDIPEAHAEAVLNLQLWRLNRQDLRRMQQELEDANSALEWIGPGDREVRLRPFAARDVDRTLFRDRATEPRPDGSTLYADERVDAEIEAGLGRIDEEAAAWFVAEDPQEDGKAVGLVIGELVNGEVEVRLWICRDCRAQGFGTTALKQVRSELAAYFPGVNLVVRTQIGRG
ncbi:GNAT family N-acetyltransferase [Tomitella biformata]|uniref:GNAT family N-acetyltransferase n=1 Tax=Tomitella biformata TaxID=630403 RepID=UPI000463E7C7|nr:GNAT family N-acetyltransferase [Tomitella biformata]